MQRTLVIVVLLSASFSTGKAIECYTCSSHEHIDCGEMFIEETSQLKPQPCDVFEGQYCIKSTGLFEGRIGTTRFCSSRNYGNYCEYIKRTGDVHEYRSCVYTCTRDGCNSSASIVLQKILLLSCIVFMLLRLKSETIH